MNTENTTNAFVAHMNLIRKTWVNVVPDELKIVLGAITKQERFAHYRIIDNDVNSLYNKNMQLIRDSGNKPDATDVMQKAAKEVISLLKLH